MRRESPQKSRHSARQLALQLLFQREFQPGHAPVSGEFWQEQPATSDVRAFAAELVDGVAARQSELDTLISQYAIDWALMRMPIVDRNILRCAMYELFWVPDVPAKVTVNEALELAKAFADDDTRRFVNGVLDRVIQHDARLETKRDAIANSCHSIG